MSAKPRLVMIEFNELCPQLMDRFIDHGDLPNFKRLREESEIYITDAGEHGELLNPWVQWVTVHTGLSAREHGVFRLSEGHLAPQRSVWDHLSAAGYTVWVCGSMNPRFDTPLNGYLLPDPWSTGVTPYPPGEFDVYQDFVREAVQEHTNPNGFAKKKAVRFVSFMGMHGLSMATGIEIGFQLMNEAMSDVGWKRPIIMDHFQSDLFRYYFERAKPDFATFFSNSTAHFQHLYWRDMAPEAFPLRSTQPQSINRADAIRLGYRNMDALLEKLLRVAGRDSVVMFCTGLSQQPFLDFDPSGGKRYYRPRSKEVFSSVLGIVGEFAYDPVMAEEFHLNFTNETAARAAARVLAGYHVMGEGVFAPAQGPNTFLFHVEHLGKAVFAKCRVHGEVWSDLVVQKEKTDVSFRFLDVFYEVDAIKSGYHHPDGMLWIRWPDLRHRVHCEKVSLCAVAPTVLDIFGLPKPNYMDVGGSLAVDAGNWVEPKNI